MASLSVNTLFYSGVPVPQGYYAGKGVVQLRFRDKFAAGLFISMMKEPFDSFSLKLLDQNRVVISTKEAEESGELTEKVDGLLKSRFGNLLPEQKKIN